MGIERFPGQTGGISTDSFPASTRPGFRRSCHMAASKSWNIFHIDLETAFLQRQSYGVNRDVVCRLLPEAGHSHYFDGWLKKPAYGMNDTPTLEEHPGQSIVKLWYGFYASWWMLSCVVLFSVAWANLETKLPYTLSRWCIWENARSHCRKSSCKRIRGRMFLIFLYIILLEQVGPKRDNESYLQDFEGISKLVQKTGTMWPEQDEEFVGWKTLNLDRPLRLGKKKAIEELKEITVERNTKEDLHCTPAMHTRYRSVLEQINWLQSRTQFQCCYTFSRCAWKAASPTIGDVKVLNKQARRLKSHPVKLQFWPLTRRLRMIASYQNNENGSSQTGMTMFLAALRERSSKDGMSYGNLTDRESQKKKNTVLSTNVAKLYSFTKCFGSCQFLQGLWMDIFGEVTDMHMRTDAKNPVTTGRTIHLLEHKETIHMISMLRKEACSGNLHDLAHISTQNC